MAGIGGVGGVEGVGGLRGATPMRGPVGARPGGDPLGGPSFADTLKSALSEVSEMQAGAEDAMGAFVRGEPIEIHEVMAAAEEAGIALEMLIEIRNKLTEAYRTVSQMQQ